MRVLFVHYEEDYYSPKKPLEGYERMQFGISYISSILKGAGHQTRLAVPTREYDTLMDEQIRDFDPGLVCFTSVYTAFAFLAEVAARVKRRHPELFLLVGGPHASLKPEECLAGAFDAVCVGEGEYATLELVEQLEAGKYPTGIANMLIKCGGGVERNETRPFLEDIDSLPFPDREMWLPWVANPLSRPSFLAGRGCPFKCTYCCNHALRRLAPGRYVRLRSPESIYREILEMKRKLPLMEEAYLEVETMGANREWALELCAKLERLNSEFEVPIEYGSNLRVTPGVDYGELFTAFRRSNFRFINIGVESGSERVRREVLKRYYANDDIIRAAWQAREHGLQVGMYNLIGIPGETRSDFMETVRLNRACRPDWFLLSVFFPYPGTRLHELSLEQGLLDGRLDHLLERRRPVLDLPGFSKRQIRRRFAWSPLLFYGGYRPAREILRMLVMARILASPGLLRRWRRLKNRKSPYRPFE